ncbi:MAG: aminomethyl-transferring glycine dehydrogenase subunit GcvPA [Candidatus Thermoplasmatota archaeon]|nr:aminomethyl-transferring glycine dehydrogenase subunit GcvPA [Candidatus Thermoplasmatota archaeon]
MEELDIDSIDKLFGDIPEKIRIKGLGIPPGKSEIDVEREISDTLKKNRSFNDMPSFLGGGIQPHYVPPAVRHIVSRSEFYTSYTPYQPEFSQGMLQSVFEYQSVICELTGMDAANISMYDFATSLGEAARMAKRINKKDTFLIPENISWEKKSVLKNYVRNAGMRIKEIPYGENGKVNLFAIGDAGDVAGIYLENPNFFGIIEDRIDEIREIKEKTDGLIVMGVDPLLLAIVKPPSEYGADIVIGDGWMGNPMNFGGSRLGIFSCRKEYIRQMPGRIIGATTDRDGKRAFCMTMQTREQHIRRKKATSNICSNEALCAIAFVAYISLLGRNGLRSLAATNVKNARYAAEELSSIGFEIPFGMTFFNEFVAIPPVNAGELNNSLLSKNMHGALLLGNHFPELKNALLYGITEMHSRETINKMVEVTGKIVEGKYV